MTEKPTIEFFYDIGSPYSYLAATQMDALAERTQAHVHWRPFLLGAVFKSSGNEAPARVANKAMWMLGDLQRWAALYGVPFRMASRFPLNTLLTQRALTAADRVLGHAAQKQLAKALFNAYWVEDRDVSAREVVLGIAAEQLLDKDALDAAIDAQETKDGLRRVTDESVQRGAFGAPAFFVQETLFWGNDRLVLLEAMLTKSSAL